MRYVIVFRVNRENSGKATYIAITKGGNTHPFQKPIEPDRCEQEFIFTKIENALNFIESAFEEFESDFEIVHFYGLKARRP